MQLRLILCMPHDLGQALVSCACLDLDALPHLACVFHQKDESESDIYKRLQTLIQEYNEEDIVVVLCDQFGSRSCTLALSMTHTYVSVVGGCNLPMLQAVQHISDAFQLLNCSPLEGLEYVGDSLYRHTLEGMNFSHTYLREAGEESSIYSSLNDSIMGDSRFS